MNETIHLPLPSQRSVVCVFCNPGLLPGIFDVCAEPALHPSVSDDNLTCVLGCC